MALKVKYTCAFPTRVIITRKNTGSIVLGNGQTNYTPIYFEKVREATAKSEKVQRDLTGRTGSTAFYAQDLYWHG